MRAPPAGRELPGGGRGRVVPTQTGAGRARVGPPLSFPRGLNGYPGVMARMTSQGRRKDE